MEERFNVVVFDAEDFWRYAARDLSAEEAVKEAARQIEAFAKALHHDWPMPDIERIIITDADDNTNFLWERGKGILYPPREEVEP